MSNKLLVIDGYSFIYRAYHVQPSLTTKKGTPVGALYGFTSMFIKILKDLKPKYVVVVLDSKGKTFRHNIYKEYKKNRPTISDDLIQQLKLLRVLIKAFNISILEKVGFEADDLIATIAKHATEAKQPLIIASSDKDLIQLMSDYIEMYNPIAAQYILSDSVKKKFGTTADKVRDVQALIGDKSDNIPGVKGIGVKIASKLVNKYGSVEAIYKSIDKIENKRYQELLTKNYNNAMLSWCLVGLNKNVKIDYKIEDFRLVSPDVKEISKFLHDYEFNSLIKRVEDLFNLKIADYVKTKLEQDIIVNNNIQEIKTEYEFNQMLSIIEQEGRVSADLRYFNNIIKISFATKNQIFIIDYYQDNILKSNLNSLIHILFADESIKKIVFNLKDFLKIIKCSLKGCEDLFLMSYCINAGKKEDSLIYIINTYSGYNIEESLDQSNVIQYFSECYDRLLELLITSKVLHLYQEIDIPLCYVLNTIEKIGIKVDTVYLRELSQEFSNEISQLENKIFTFTGQVFNILSPKKLGEILFDKMKLPFSKLLVKSKYYTTSSDILEKLKDQGYEIASLILKFRHFSKLKNTYIDNLLKQVNNKTNRIHTTFLQASTITGRLSSRSPNLQNIPIRTIEGNKIRAAFITQKGYKLISADYSQIELRILSCVANIKPLKEAFINNVDIHTQTASQIFSVKAEEVDKDMRRKAKAINFGIIYGISAFGLAKQLNITRTKAQQYIDKYFYEYPGIEKYMINTIDFAKKYGYVTNFLGRKSFIININSKDYSSKSLAERTAINAPIQSFASEIVKIAMVELYQALERLQMKTKMILQIHDELIFESPNNEVNDVIPIIKSIMEKSYCLEDILFNVHILSGDRLVEI